MISMTQEYEQTANDPKGASNLLQNLVAGHERYRRNCLNMVAAESATSPAVEAIVGSDLSRRYSSPGVYAGDQHFVQAQALVIDLLKRLFRVEQVNLRPATGNLAVMAVVTGLTGPGDSIVKVGDQHGGFPIRLAEWAGVKIVPFPFDFDRLNIQAAEAVEQVRELRPQLIIFGASEFLYPHPVREIAAAAHEIGALVAYDGSHVMGLIAGGQFQDPVREGADVLFGSTHKTFPGPQRGVVMTNSAEVMARIDRVLAPPPFLLSAYHLNTTIALGVAAAEMLAFGPDFAAQIVQNSQALARGLQAEGLPVFTADSGCTRSHQVILENGGFVSPEGVRIKEAWERCGILADAVVRIGTQEVTRHGMRPAEMGQIAALMADAALGRRPEPAIRVDVEALANAFQRLHYCF